MQFFLITLDKIVTLSYNYISLFIRWFFDFWAIFSRKDQQGMAQTSIGALVVEVSIAKVPAVAELLKAIQRRGITLLVSGKDTVEMRSLERQGLVMARIHGKPSATKEFVNQCVGMARVAVNNLRLGSAEVLFVDRDEDRLAC